MRRPSRAAALSGPVALTLLLPLTACGAGKEAQTSQVRNHPDSSSGRAGEVLLRHVRIANPGGIEGIEAGGSARVYGSIISSPDVDDELVSVSTEAAQRAVVRPADGETGPIEVPADTRVELGPDAGYVELVGLSETLRGGTFVTVTFTFRESGDSEIDVPVETLTDD